MLKVLDTHKAELGAFDHLPDVNLGWTLHAAVLSEYQYHPDDHHHSRFHSLVGHDDIYTAIQWQYYGNNDAKTQAQYINRLDEPKPCNHNVLAMWQCKAKQYDGWHEDTQKKITDCVVLCS